MKIHFVKQGDTFAALSEKYGVSEQTLINANPHVRDSGVLSQGMKIKIPAVPAAVVAAAEPPAQPVPVAVPLSAYGNEPAPLTAPTSFYGNAPVQLTAPLSTYGNEPAPLTAPVTLPSSPPMPNFALQPAAADQELFKYEHIPSMPVTSLNELPSMPVSSLYDLPALDMIQEQQPWGMPYPLMNQYFPQPNTKPCGCGSSQAIGMYHPPMQSWSAQLPYSSWLPYAMPYRLPAELPPGIVVHGSGFPEYPEQEASGKELPIETEEKAVTSQITGEQKNGAAKRKKTEKQKHTRKPANPGVAKIRKLSRSNGAGARSKSSPSPWINR